MSKADRARLRELLGKATPGPWECDDYGVDFPGARYGEVAYVLSKTRGRFEATSDNAALIVAAVNALPALLDRIDALEAGLRSVIDAADSFCDEEGYEVAGQVKLRARALLNEEPGA